MGARRFWIGVVVAVAIAAGGIGVSRLVGSPVIMAVMTQATFYALFALGVGLLFRQNGMVSFGHAIFFGMPSYLVGIGLQHTGLSAEVLLLGSVVAVTGLGFLVGLVFVRVHGIAFGMLTLAVGQMAYEVSGRFRELTGGYDGMSLKFPRTLFGVATKTFEQAQSMFAVSWCVLIVVLALVIVVAHSRFGVLTVAIRENEERAGFLGYRTLLPRALVFTLSAGVVAIGGTLFALYNAFVSPTTMHWAASGEALIMAILGGTALPWGPVLGAYIFFVLKETLGSITTHWMGIIGACLILVSVAFPQGLAGLAEWALRRRRSDANT